MDAIEGVTHRRIWDEAASFEAENSLRPGFVHARGDQGEEGD